MPAAECQEACARVFELLDRELEGLPESQAMREDLREASGVRCERRCQRLGDPESLRCILGANSVLELGVCQGSTPFIR